jgi:uncharacterized protein RhaS with RHS repeats
MTVKTAPLTMEEVRPTVLLRQNYDPSQGRFISEDSWTFLTGPNFYSYTTNDPVGQIDPTGHQQQNISSIPPVYEPGQWNDPGHIHTNNCYSYAIYCIRLVRQTSPNLVSAKNGQKPSAKGRPAAKHSVCNRIVVYSNQRS